MACLLIAIFAVFLLAATYPIYRWAAQQDKGEQRRGFEVKSTTGTTPVILKERDNDHG